MAAEAPQQSATWITLEGLDGVGKSTVVKALTERLAACALRTPPDVIEPFRAKFTAGRAPEDPQRKTFYQLGNYMAGAEAMRAIDRGQHVVCDRYYASTHSYVYGQACGDIPEAGSPAYAWPDDLPRPHHMVLLTLPEEERIRRRAARTTVDETDEELRLRKQAALGQRINEAYRRFGCVEVPAVGSVDEIVDRILAVTGIGAAGTAETAQVGNTE